MEYKSGLTEQSTRVSGTETKRKVRVHSGMLKATFILGSLERTRPMDMGFIIMLMGANMKGNGSMTSRKDKARKSGLMEPSTSENIRTA